MSPAYTPDTLRLQAIEEIRQKVELLSSLTDGQGRNVKSFSAMRATGHYVIHRIITETEYSDLFRQAWQGNGLLHELGVTEFDKTVKRALEGCQNDPFPKLKRKYRTSSQQPKNFSDKFLLKQNFRHISTYQFHDADQTPVYQKRRYEQNGTKRFLYRHLNADDQWMQGRGTHQEYPYHLSDMLGDLVSPVILCEGEKDADTAKSLGLLATSVSNWKDCAHYFRGRDVIIVPDQDEAGRKKSLAAHKALSGLARTIKILQLPDLPDKGDLTDWVVLGGTREDFDTLVTEAPTSAPVSNIGHTNGIPTNTRANILSALREINVHLSYNSLSDAIEIHGLGGMPYLTDITINFLRLELCEQKGFRINRDLFHDLVTAIAHQNARHPIKTYLENLTWDQNPRVERFFIDIGDADDTVLIRRITEIWFTAAVRRLYEPGIDFQELLILEGEQGQGKSTAIRKLCSDPDWFSDDLPLNASPRVIVEQTLGKWIIEASELTGRNQDSRNLKRFLSATTDRARMAYDRYARDVPRQWVAIGTTNEREYLIDSTGNRRFWPIRTGRFNLDALTPQYRDQLWAEAVQLHQRGKSIKLEQDLWGDATREQERRFNGDPWEDLLKRLLPEEECSILVSSILEALHVPLEKQDRRASTRAAYIMRKNAFEKTTMRHPISKKVVKIWRKGKGGPLKKLTFSGISDT